MRDTLPLCFWSIPQTPLPRLQLSLSIVLSLLPSAQVVVNLPVLDQLHPKYAGYKKGMEKIYRNYPVAGTSVMFTLDPGE